MTIQPKKEGIFVCRKCGSEDIWMYYWPTIKNCHPNQIEHLQCKCRRCKFEWKQPPLEQDE